MNDGSDCSYAGPPESGVAKVAIHRQFDGRVDEFSFELSRPILVGHQYTLTFYAWANQDFDQIIRPVEVGISQNSNGFGTLIFSGMPSDQSWTYFESRFVAPLNASYVTVRVAGPSLGWNHLDNFTLIEDDATP